MSRKANSAPLPRKSRKTKSRAYSLGPDYLNRRTYGALCKNAVVNKIIT